MSNIITTVREYERFTPAAQEAFRAAQRLALSMDARAIAPEHLLIAIVLQNDERVTQVLDSMGMDVKTIRGRVADLARNGEAAAQEDSELPLSKEAQESVNWALAFISYMHATAVLPDHLLLGVLRHPRTQPLLAFLLPSLATLESPLMQETGVAYTDYIDQLISTRVRDQSIVSYGRGTGRRILRKFERPAVTFIGVMGLDKAKREAQDIIEYLKASPAFQQTGGRFPHGVLLTGSTGNERRLLVQAVAGEAVVPLVMLSMTALVELLVDLHHGELLLEDLELPARECSFFRRGSIAEKGQRYIQYLFQQAKTISPGVLFIEDIDALARLGRNEGREQLLYQLLSEMDALDKHYRMVVMASAGRSGDVDDALLRPGRFEQRIVLESTPAAEHIEPGEFCSTCKREVQPEWLYCVYCGSSLTQVCAQCGALRPAIAGARFCSSCGTVFQ
ncbi:MAG TPA: AAA family ATPase [Ktedonobacteraceae bacterium]|nr:AAA family ATPase [Ktedonobacteraceae bacterium]